MNWITTNIRFPEDVYMELKIEAAERRKSVAALVRERVERKQSTVNIKSKSILEEIEKLARKNAKVLKGVNLTKALIDMRYGQ